MRSIFQAYTASLTPDLRIMDLLDNQPEFTKSFWDYLDILVTNERIEQGRALLEKYRSAFDAVERAYGVDRYTIAAIWGVETNYGTLTGDRSVVRSTATLACIGRQPGRTISARNSFPRWKFSSAEMFGPIVWSGRGQAHSDRPSSCRPHSRNMRWISTGTAAAMSLNSALYIIASTANNLKKDGWIKGETWGYESWCRRRSISYSRIIRGP